ncbi:MAG TPA: hypothetical protein DDX99_04290 [Desulfofustis sp.]|jgi:hypothetical protein|nr:hypothetical protein [Desulfofustis sp. PB-SRB1]HBH28050.1 hypothetical protein [Desulfofustis sp.]HBH31107.1 hypothetical protein [Desulfofustis sp.]
MNLILVILLLFGQLTVITKVIEGKKFSVLKTILVAIYLLVGINLPLLIYAYLIYRVGGDIPILGFAITFYVLGLCIMGLTAIGHSLYKFIKFEIIGHLKRKKHS